MVFDKKNISSYCLLLVLLVGMSVPAHAGHREAPARGIYQLPEIFGTITDFFLSRGQMSEKHIRLFEEVAQQLQIEHRGIKLRNSGFLLRLFPVDLRFLFNYLSILSYRLEGYYGIRSHQSLNRVYLNEDWLNQMTDEQKRFVIAHSLTHHSQDHGFMREVVLWILSHIVNTLRASYVSKNQGRLISLAQMVCIMQLFQKLEHYSDEQAAELAYCPPVHLAAVVKSLYYPDAEDAPWYARLQMFAKKAICTITSLPIIKSFVAYRSMHDRAAHVSGVKDDLVLI
ncbi:MAG TPA: M48 family metalloprotease [Candidatus Babeliales bacterium]|nr:M48 family metalloprotease [Candidatus Babeliales bacterium]